MAQGDAAAARVADALRRDLFAGRLAQGERIKEHDLATHYGVGRYTVRAALQLLVARGLLRHESNKGAAVPTLSAEWIHDMYDYREVLEVGALRLAFAHGADFSGVESAVAALERMSVGASWEETTAAHRAVHQALVDAAENTHISTAYRSCGDELQLMLAYITPDISGLELARRHRHLMTQLRRAEAHATEALRADLEITGRQSLIRATDSPQRKDKSEIALGQVARPTNAG